MRSPEIRPLPIAVRVFPYADIQKENRWTASFSLPQGMLVIETAERTGSAQGLRFGTYRLIVGGECLEEGLFYADDLSRRGLQVLKDYVLRLNANAPPGDDERLRLLTRREFLDLFYQLAYKARCHVVGFELPNLISQLACDAKPARGFYAGGFSFCLWTYKDRRGRELPDGFRPRVCIKRVDGNRSLIGFTGRNSPDQVDLIPEGSPSGKPQPGYKFRGHFLDLRTLAFALTDEGYSLQSACEAFGVDHRKEAIPHGSITKESIDDLHRDVLAISELATKLVSEFAKHPIPVSPTHVLSPAGIGKGYLRAMGVSPILKRQPDFPKEYLGYAQTAFFGGKTNVHVRKVVCPVVYTDFLSMYSTINCLMRIWSFVIANEIHVIEHCKDEVDAFFRRLTADILFEPETWTRMNGFVKVVPNGAAVLPIRSKYSPASNDWQVGVNHVYAKKEDALWYAIPDVVASILATGRVPEIVDAFVIEPSGVLFELAPTKLRGIVDVAPEHDDFFRVIVDERLRLSSRADVHEIETKRLGKALKILASATCFGIYAQMDRQDDEGEVEVKCHGIDPDPYTCTVAHPEFPGEFCFPPIASLITSGARLMLALLDHCISELGGVSVMEDTDSCAIISTEHGGLVPCPGGPFEMADGGPAVRALSWKEVAEIVARFAKLNPYTDKSRSILKIERDNYDPETGEQRQIYCLAIASKRYALFLRDEDGNPILLQKGVNNHEDRWSEHGLGHLRNPMNSESEDRDWIRQAWINIIRRTLGLPVEPLGFENLPAIGRVPITSPTALRSLAKLNRGKKYRNRIKPFDFLLSCHVKHFGHPPGVDPEKFHLVAPYVPDPSAGLICPGSTNIREHSMRSRRKGSTAAEGSHV